MTESPALDDAMVCRELVELVTDYLEGALTPAQHARFAAHLAMCPPCGEYVDQIRRTVQAVGRVGATPVGPAERAVLLALFRQWRDQSAD